MSANDVCSGATFSSPSVVMSRLEKLRSPCVRPRWCKCETPLHACNKYFWTVAQGSSPVRPSGPCGGSAGYERKASQSLSLPSPTPYTEPLLTGCLPDSKYRRRAKFKDHDQTSRLGRHAIHVLVHCTQDMRTLGKVFPWPPPPTHAD
eukprot:8735998-Lingulodinium_polyedra.AAC.1